MFLSKHVNIHGVHSNGVYDYFQMEENPTKIYFCIRNEVLKLIKKNNKLVINTSSTCINEYPILLYWNKHKIKC